MASKGDDSFAAFDALLTPAAEAPSPWRDGVFVADMDLLRKLLTIPISQGDRQESGKPAKALDTWIAQELRRAGFPEGSVWPRPRRPRVLAEGLADAEAKLERLDAELEHAEESGERLKPSSLRRAIREAVGSLPSNHEAYILGDFYAKQIDVGLSSWRRGPDLLISTKTMFSAYRKNLKNRHEEAVGEVSSLRRRHPMAAMGYAYLVRQNIYDEEGAYPILQDILTRLRRPGETFDATLLLVADWPDGVYPASVGNIDQPLEGCDATSFFTELIEAVTTRTPIGEHRDVRLKRDGMPVGGLPDLETFTLEQD